MFNVYLVNFSNKFFSFLNNIPYVIATIFLVTLLSSCSVTTERIRVRVVDSGSGAPIEGAVAVYEIHSATNHGTNYTQKAIYETESNANGWIEIPPLEINTFFISGLRSPTLMILKSGYNPEFVQSNSPIIPALQDVIKWNMNGKTVGLNVPKNLEEYARQIDYLDRELSNLYDWPNDDVCGWKSVPRAIMSVEWEVMNIETKSKYRFGSTVLRSLILMEAYPPSSKKILNKCGSPTKLFESIPLKCPFDNGMMNNVLFRMQLDDCSVGLSAIFHVLGHCEYDNQNWLFIAGRGWRPVPIDNLDRIKDKCVR